MEKKMKETTDRAKAWKCVRLNDKNGFSTKFNKTNFPNESRREVYYYSVKCVEHGMRGFSPTFVATKKKFLKFQKVSEGLKLEPLPEGFQFLTHVEKREAVKKLVNTFDNEIAAAMGRAPVQDVDMQVNDPGQIRVDEVPAAAPNPGQIQVDEVPAAAPNPGQIQVDEVLAAAPKLGQIQVDEVPAAAPNPGQIQVDEVPAAAPNPGQIQVDEVLAAAPNPDFGNTVSNDASSLNVTWNQCDNPEGRPPPRPPVQLDLLVYIFDDLMRRASRFPGILPKLMWSEAALRSLVIQLELLEGAFNEKSGTHFRSSQEEFYAPLTDYTADEAITSLPSMDESLADEFWSNFFASPGRDS